MNMNNSKFPFFIHCACMFALNYELILLLLIILKTLMLFFLLDIYMTINMPALVKLVHGVHVFYSYKRVAPEVVRFIVHQYYYPIKIGERIL